MSLVRSYSRELLAVYREERDGLLVVYRVRAHQPEVQRVLSIVDGQASKAVADRTILGLRERLRIDHLHGDLAAGGAPILIEQLADAGRIVADSGDLGDEPTREVEPQSNRLVELREGRSSTLGKGVDVVFGEVEPCRGERGAAEYVDREQRHQRHQQSTSAEQSSVHAANAPCSARSGPRWRTARRRSAR